MAPLRLAARRVRLYACPALAALASATAAAPKVEFNRDVRPIMADTCFRCHGPDSSSRMAGMRLDIREKALERTKSGVIPIVPGKPEESAIIQRVFAASPAKRMPPNYAHKDLTEAQKDTLRRWVAEGAEYQKHWAYLPVARPAVPAPSGGTVRNPVDAFIQARLNQEGLAPAPEASRRTLIRRASLDLTGLPPTPAEVSAFLADRAPDAYERLVDRLLASPRYAEQQALHWLDAVRYADTCGFHGDNPFPAWPYRDYVLRAFLNNKPFDEFTREQLAGDLIPGATTEQRVASAYNRLNRTSAEGGIQPAEYLAKYGADRVRTTSTVWMGSTMGCAECHDHKFDPFASKDFYSMKAFFADIKETGLVEDRGPNAWGSQLALPTPEQTARLKAADAAFERARLRLTEAAVKFLDGQAAREKNLLESYDAGRLAWCVQRPLAVRSEAGAVLKVYNDELVDTAEDLRGSLVFGRRPGSGLVVASGPVPDNDVYTIRLRPGAGEWTALGVELIQDESLPGVRLARGSDRMVLSEVEAWLSVPGGVPRRLPFVLATANTSFPRAEMPAMAAIDGNPATGWGVADYGDARAPFLALRFSSKLRTGPNTVLEVKLRHESAFRRATAGRFRLALSSAEYSWPGTPQEGAKGPGGLPDSLVSALRTPAAERSPEQARAALEHFRWASPELEPLVAEAARLEMRRDLIDAGIPRVVVAEATEPEEIRILPRGNFLDETGAVVTPAIPGFLGKLDVNGRATRLDLANWLVSAQNPLTARVFVNRLWREFFGTGISKTLDDLGSQGEWPTHPELLDWLAAEFVAPAWQARGTHAWDIRHVVRTIVTSHTYRQASQAAPEAEAKDPFNRLLAHQSRFRVDAEAVRDIALASAGLLVEKFGGPSVRPYQPDGYLAALNFPKRDYSAGRGADLYRRSVYTHWQRSFLHPTMVAFDAPTREECTVNRTSSNTPLQALVLLNEPGMVEAARVLAGRALEGGAEAAADGIARIFDRTLQRAPERSEIEVLQKLHGAALAHFRAAPADARSLLRAGDAPLPPDAGAPELAAMTVVARVILNLHETITRE